MKIKCIGCELQKNKIETIGGLLYETKYFEVRQDYELPIPGFLIIASKRHIIGFANFTKNEQKDFIEIVCKIRKIMKNKLKIKFVNLFMREETIENKKSPSHFHMGLLPKYKWMNKIKSDYEIFKYSRDKMNNKKNLGEVKKMAEKLKKYLN